jgi:hypothetical protein
MSKPESYWKGFEAKTEEIKQMGFTAARDKFNLEHPIGCKHETADGHWYSHGEFDALCSNHRTT